MITYQSVSEVLFNEGNPLLDMFNTEELWLDNQVKDGLIAIVSNYPHPEITSSQAKQLKEYLEPYVDSMPIYLPDGLIDWYIEVEA
jgi:hypothetical protein